MIYATECLWPAGNFSLHNNTVLHIIYPRDEKCVDTYVRSDLVLILWSNVSDHWFSNYLLSGMEFRVFSMELCPGITCTNKYMARDNSAKNVIALSILKPFDIYSTVPVHEDNTCFHTGFNNLCA